MRIGLRLVPILVLVFAGAACAGAPAQPNLTSRYLVGRVAAQSNSLGAAAKAFAAAHAAAPGERAILEDALFFHLAAGDVAAATPFARRIVDLASSTNAENRASNPAAAKTAGNRTPDAGLARITLAAEAIHDRHFEEARASLQGEIKAPFLKSIAFLMDVWIERALAGPEAALAKLDNPGADMFDGFNALHRALLLEEAGRVEDARASYQAAVFGLGGPVGRAAYGAFLERIGDVEAARGYYELLAGEAGPARRAAEEAFQRLDKGEATKAYADMTPGAGAAIALYSHASAIVEYAADTRSRAVNAGFHVGDPQLDLPLTLARLALYLDPHRDEARRLVGWILGAYGDYEGARLALAEIRPSSPHFEQARIEMAGALSAAGRAREATRLLKDTIRRNDGAIEAKLMLGQLEAGEGRRRAAIAVFTDVIDGLGEKPADDAWRYYIARGDALLQLGRWDEAESDLKRALEIAPEEPTTLNYLGYSWAERGLNLEKAFGLIEKAVELQPQSGAIIDSLGWAHYQLGDYAEAVGHLEKAVSFEPSDPTITDHLGDVYWRLGREIEARYEWRRALTFDPPEKLRAELRRKLSDGLAVEN
ncbi:MAG: tetratricopeptide repeat protein [Amphiplicatus sp.]